MFESKRENESAVTLCIFPHLREFVAIDNRRSLPGRPVVKALKHDEVTSGDFYQRMEQDFSKLLRRPEQGFLGMMAMPQEVEALLRAHSMRRVMESINSDLTEPAKGEVGSVGVMFFAGGLLSVDEGQLKEVIEELFDDVLAPGQVRDLHSRLFSLLKQERDAVAAASKSELAKLILGDGGPYVTLWGRESN